MLAVDRDEAGLVPYHGDDAVTTHVADGTHEDEVAAYAARAKELWGSVDAFANNAGVEGQVAPVTDPAVEDFDKVPAVNVRRFFSGLKHVLPFMEEGASVVNTASPLGLVGGAGLAPYVASKNAVIGVTKSAALEHALPEERGSTPSAPHRSLAG